MRDLPVTVALSLLIHVAAVTWFVARENSEAERPVAQQTARVEIVAPLEEPPVDVVLFDDNTVKSFPDDAPVSEAAKPAVAKLAPADARKRATTVIAATTTTTTELPPSTDPPSGTEKSKLSMRNGNGRPEPTIYRPGSDDISDEMLKLMIEGKIPVKIENLPGAQANADFIKASARLNNPKFVASATPEQLAAARFDREAARQAKKDVELVAQKDGSYKSEKTTFKATVNPDGSVDFKDKANWQQKSLFYGEFDVTDAFMRRHGQDPYAAEKLKYLDRTRDQRVEIGKRYRTAQLAKSAQLMAANLKTLWATTADEAERKRMLFAMWDECAETGDEELIAAGADARRLLGNWITVHEVAFTTAELATFNAKKTSKATFAP